MKCVRIWLLVSILLGFSYNSLSTEIGGFNDGRRPFQSQRHKTLNCTCGSLPNKDRDPTHFPWDVIISPALWPPNPRLRVLSKDDSDGNETSSSSSSFKGRRQGEEEACPGTLINNKIVLTSVKCILKLSRAELFDEVYRPLLFPGECVYTPQDLRVWTQVDIPSLDLPAGNKGRKISHIYYHPLYLPSQVYYGKLDYDVALVTLKEPIVLGGDYGHTRIVPVCLPDKPLKYKKLVGRQVQITDPLGWIPSTSFIYPRGRCRVNSGRKWISERFLCTLALNLSDSRSMKAGSGVVLKDKHIFTQYGLVSWMTYYPLLANKKALSLSTNIAGFIQQIETYSAKMGAEWCMNDWNGLPTWRYKKYNETFVNEPVTPDKRPWEGLHHPSREIRKSCKCGKVNSLSPKGRIQGGKDAPAYEYGWIVQLSMKRGVISILCGGSIINDRIVMTAAHCVFSFNSDDPEDLIEPENVQVRASRYKGPQSSDENSFLAPVEKVVPHPGYSLSLVKNDIALLVLSKPLNFKHMKGKVSPICFPEARENVDSDGRNDAIIIGWGRTDITNPKSHAGTLQELQVRTVSNDDCLDILRTYGSSLGIFKSMVSDGRRICAGNFRPVKDYKDPAQGDSGGPLFIPIRPGSNTMIQIGIASLVTMAALADEDLADELKTVTVYTRTQCKKISIQLNY